jgi:hypothetical protein
MEKVARNDTQYQWPIFRERLSLKTSNQTLVSAPAELESEQLQSGVETGALINHQNY